MLVQERGSVFVLGQAIKQEHPDSDQELCRNDGIWPFAITVNCHPKFVSGSGPEEPRTWTRSVEEPFFSKDGSMLFDEPRTALCSVQRVFALKRAAVPRISMLKQVQTDSDVFEITSAIIPVMTSQSSLSLSSRTCFGICSSISSKGGSMIWDK